VISGETQFQMRKDLPRKRLLKYTRKAFRMLPKLDRPRILDIGCGSGIPTIELAQLSNGELVGLDIDQGLLDKMVESIEEAGLSDRVKTVNCSLFNMTFPDESFDIIWAEGSISVIGFERGLTEWKRLLKPNGFMAIHDEKGDVEQKLKQISGCGYELLSYFELDEGTWWNEYFAPLQEIIDEFRVSHASDPELFRALADDQREIDMFQKNPERNSSVLFVMQKRE
jgi:ubiquinone/menaquinone biosynthesis C-methylase UbiE